MLDKRMRYRPYILRSCFVFRLGTQQREKRKNNTKKKKKEVGTYHFRLILGMGVNPSSVLCPPVAPLPVNLGGVDAAEEDIAERLEGHLGGIVENLR